jgi:hypothetical protein
MQNSAELDKARALVVENPECFGELDEVSLAYAVTSTSRRGRSFRQW